MRTVLDLGAVAPDGIVKETVENQCLENAASLHTTAYHVSRSVTACSPHNCGKLEGGTCGTVRGGVAWRVDVF